MPSYKQLATVSAADHVQATFLYKDDWVQWHFNDKANKFWTSTLYSQNFKENKLKYRNQDRSKSKYTGASKENKTKEISNYFIITHNI